MTVSTCIANFKKVKKFQREKITTGRDITKNVEGGQITPPGSFRVKHRNNTRMKKKKNRKKKWYDNDCKHMYCQLKSLARLIIRQTPTNLALVHQYRNLRKSYSRLLSKKKVAFRKSIFDRLDKLQSDNPQALWELYEELCEKKQVADNLISPKQWWSHFTNLMNRNIPHIDTNFESFIDTFIDNLSVGDVISLDYHITPDEVAKAARLLKNGKASGIDGIRSEMLKVGIDRLASSLSNLFNLILKQGSFPTPWRVSTLTVIYKKGDKSIPKNYRGIAVSSILCKLFCLVLHSCLNEFTNINKVIIPQNQIGFRKGSRTSDHVLVLKSLIDKYINGSGKSYLGPPICLFY